jgi:endonuclease/exonuclease/phosphatase family metal-dependent hydrolase
MRPTLAVATWNVLHRIHAENWGEAPIERFPDERARLAGIAARVAAILEAGCAAVCLQEVSGDQLAALRAAAPRATLLSSAYPRGPWPRRRDGAPPAVAQLVDPTEHLVTVVAPGVAARLVEAAAFDDDPGKGLLAVELDGGWLLVDVHVSYGARQRGQLARVAHVAGARPGPTAILGDFNADATQVAAALGDAYALVVPAAPALPTRPRTSGDKSQTIDHVALRGATATAAFVRPVDGLSDHNLVEAILTAGT